MAHCIPCLGGFIALWFVLEIPVKGPKSGAANRAGPRH
jgi:hypothetical protein